MSVYVCACQQLHFITIQACTISLEPLAHKCPKEKNLNMIMNDVIRSSLLNSSLVPRLSARGEVRVGGGKKESLVSTVGTCISVLIDVPVRHDQHLSSLVYSKCITRIKSLEKVGKDLVSQQGVT